MAVAVRASKLQIGWPVVVGLPVFVVDLQHQRLSIPLNSGSAVSANVGPSRFQQRSPKLNRVHLLANRKKNQNLCVMLLCISSFMRWATVGGTAKEVLG